AGVALTFGLWWTYFVIPWGEVLQHHRERAFFWGYGHMAIFGGIAATGAGLHVGQYYLEHETHLSAIATLLAVVVPVAVYLGMLYLMYAVGMRAADRFQLLLIVPTAAALVLAVALVASGASYPIGLAIVALAPIITIVGHETIGHRHVSAHLDRLRD
ncbi:MAG: low temperature requirement protein A, partial [Acidimicrobiales bacterium]|nr:low temperature requirement protein A [Acidimicrobiales bacterium]